MMKKKSLKMEMSFDKPRQTVEETLKKQNTLKNMKRNS